MSDALAALEESRTRVAALAATAGTGHTKNLTVAEAQPVASAIAKPYFESARAELRIVQSRVGLSEEIDSGLQALLQLAAEPSAKKTYITSLKSLDGKLLEATVEIMKGRGTPRLVLSDTERAILATLDGLLPHSAASYEQCLRDLSQGGRVSWRGTATELREVLREVMDHFAPDDKVMAAPGFTLEDNQTKPTQRQKVRYILKARRSTSAAINVAEGTLDTVEETVAALARSTYQRGSVSTHTKANDTEIRNLKRYAEALLAELLEVK